MTSPPATEKLRRVGEGFFHFMRLRTNEHVRRFVFIGAGPHMWRGQMDMSRPNGGSVSCDGLARRIDYDLNTITLTVPRSCLSNPRWVQLTVQVESFATTDANTYYLDNPHNDQAQYHGWSDKVRRG